MGGAVTRPPGYGTVVGSAAMRPERYIGACSGVCASSRHTRTVTVGVWPSASVSSPGTGESAIVDWSVAPMRSVGDAVR